MFDHLLKQCPTEKKGGEDRYKNLNMSRTKITP